MNSSTKFHWKCCTHSCIYTFAHISFRRHSHSHFTMFHSWSCLALFSRSLLLCVCLSACVCVCVYFANWVDHFNISIVQMLHKPCTSMFMSSFVYCSICVSLAQFYSKIAAPHTNLMFGKCQCLITVIFFHHSLFNHICLGNFLPVDYLNRLLTFCTRWNRIRTTFLRINLYTSYRTSKIYRHQEQPQQQNI